MPVVTFEALIPVVTFEPLILLRVFPKMRDEERMPVVTFEAFRFERPEAFPEYRVAVIVFRFEIPRTLSVDAPYTTAELTVR
jgi:hypothetical protein